MTGPAPPTPLPKAGQVLLALWAVLFVLGALGELFGIEALRFADLKRLFLE